jgi:hypothetical protein
VVAANPDYIVLRRHRDLRALRHYVWIRRGLVLLLGAFLLVGLLNGFGQRPKTSSAETGAARLELYAPSRVRGGLYFEARFHITAVREIRDAVLVLDPGWAEGMTINTIEPSPIGEASRDGKLALDLGHIPRGQSYLLFMQLQVNPTNVGRRSQNVELFDGDRHLLTIDRTVTIFP